MSIAYQRVSARLQYGLQYMGGRQLVLRMRLLGISQRTTEVGVVVAVEHSRSRISIQYHKTFVRPVDTPALTLTVVAVK